MSDTRGGKCLLPDQIESLLADQLTDTSEFARIETHLQACSACRRYIETRLLQRSGDPAAEQLVALDVTRFRNPALSEPATSADTVKYPDSHFRSLLSSAAGVPGEVVGRYRLIELLGCGGMGTVWRAEQLSPVQRQVALKVIRAGMISIDVVARFEVERQTLAMMDHPSIAKILDAGMTAAGLPFFVMELVDGQPITTFCDENSLSLPERLELVTLVCNAVQHAHSKGVIHRDLKPSNILVRFVDGHPAPTVIDFGLAKVLRNDQPTDATAATAFGQLIGTLDYMSPEQAELNQCNVDGRTDVYTLGIVLYKLLRGSTPFEPTDVPDRAPLAILNAIRTRDPIRPGLRVDSDDRAINDIALRRKTGPQQLREELNGEVGWIVMKALEREPPRRYQTPARLADDIRRYLTGESVLAKRPSMTERFYRALRRQRIFVASATLVLTALLTGALVLRHQQVEHQIELQQQDSVNRRMQAVARVDSLVVGPPSGLSDAIDSLEPFRGHAIPLLKNKISNVEVAPRHRLQAAFALASLDKIDPVFLINAIPESDPRHCVHFVRSLELLATDVPPLLVEAAERLESRLDWIGKARVAIVALWLGEESVARDMCLPRADPTQRTCFTETLTTWHGDLSALLQHRMAIEEGWLRSALLLGMGSISPDSLSNDEVRSISMAAREWYSAASDSGTHSAAGFLLRKWKIEEPDLPREGELTGSRQWHVNESGLTMLRIPAGSFQRHITFEQDSHVQDIEVTQDFLIADRELTRGQFLQFLDDPQYPEEEKPEGWDRSRTAFGPTSLHPVYAASWNDAVMYCNWLSHRERLSACYVRTRQVTADSSAATNPVIWTLNVKEANGYHLPTEAQWEYACRAGTNTIYSHGATEDSLDRVSVYRSSTTQPVGSRWCNAWGLFDVHGNVFEWCNDLYAPYVNTPLLTDPIGPEQGSRRVSRGGSFPLAARVARSDMRRADPPDDRHGNYFGIRVAKTLPAR